MALSAIATTQQAAATSALAGSSCIKESTYGSLPVGWNVLPLLRCLRKPPQYGINAAAVACSDLLPTYLRITDINASGRFTPSPRVSINNALSNSYFLSPGDLVFARTGASVGKSYLYNLDDGPLVFAGFLIRIAPDPNILNPAFLAQYVQTKTYWDWVNTVSARSGQPGINGREYSEMPVPIPPINEQLAIADALSDIDDLIASLDRLIAKKQDIKRTVIQQLLSGKTRLPGFGSEWQKIQLGSHVSFLKTASNSRADLSSTGQVKYLHYGDIHTSNQIRLDASLESMPRLDVVRARAADRLQVGDLVLVDASEDTVGVGKSVEIAGVPVTGAIAGLHTIAARFDKAVLADGFKGYLQFHPEFRAALLRLAAGTKVLATSKNHIASIDMKLPDVEEQHAIARVLTDMDAELDVLKQQRDKTKAIKQGMTQELLTGRTRLVTQGGAR